MLCCDDTMKMLPIQTQWALFHNLQPEVNSYITMQISPQFDYPGPRFEVTF